MKELKFKVKLEGVTSGEVAALSAPFDVEKAFGTRARACRYAGRSMASLSGRH
jgi:hypothetical protein